MAKAVIDVLMLSRYVLTSNSCKRPPSVFCFLILFFFCPNGLGLNFTKNIAEFLTKFCLRLELKYLGKSACGFKGKFAA